MTILLPDTEPEQRCNTKQGESSVKRLEYPFLVSFCFVFHVSASSLQYNLQVLMPLQYIKKIFPNYNFFNNLRLVMLHIYALANTIEYKYTKVSISCSHIVDSRLHDLGLVQGVSDKREQPFSLPAGE